ncbi:MAG: D-amino acid aminotransferase [Gemmatimonadaceae bacterium]
MMATCWLNGRFLPEEQAQVSIFDRGLLFGDGIYEVAAVFNGRLLDADLHLARLRRSLAAIQMDMPLSEAEWADVMQSLATQNGVQEGLVYLQVTRGAAERDFAFPSTVAPTCFAFARPKVLAAPQAVGITAHVVEDLRWARRDIKSVAMLAQVLAKQAAKAAGAQEAIMHMDGVVTEGGSSNVWIVEQGIATTRPLSQAILPGITRSVAHELAAQCGIPVRDEPFTVDRVRQADECFITSATSFVTPITRIDDVVVGSGMPGPLTLQLRDAYIARAQALTR